MENKLDRSWPSHDRSRRVAVQTSAMLKLTEATLWDFRSTGSDVPGGEYFGRSRGAILAQTRVILDKYVGVDPDTLSINERVIATIGAANLRLAEMGLKPPVRPEEVL